MSSQLSDPFLMLDELGPVVYKKGEFAGAPWHPHRGFDTVMYMKEGEGQHQDSMGNKGILRRGDVQWMTAGSGIIHDEGKNHPGGLLHGFQMWVNLPKKHKMDDPCYQQITGENFPFVKVCDGVEVKCIVGKIMNPKDPEKVLVESPLKPIVPIEYLDVNMASGAKFSRSIDAQFDTLIVYVYQGRGKFTDGEKEWKELKRKDTILYSNEGQGLEIENVDKKEALGFLLLAGKKIKEPIAWRGPFVMNSMEEIEQAFDDYHSGTLVKAKGKEKVF